MTNFIKSSAILSLFLAAAIFASAPALAGGDKKAESKDAKKDKGASCCMDKKATDAKADAKADCCADGKECKDMKADNHSKADQKATKEKASKEKTEKKDDGKKGDDGR